MHCISFMITVHKFQQFFRTYLLHWNSYAQSAPMQMIAQIVAILKTHLLLIMQIL